MYRSVAKLLLFVAVCCAACSTPKAQMTPVGRFAAMQQNGEHCSGYSVELWKLDGKLYGLFHACSGLVGDTPTGVLDNVQTDAKTKSISFEAKLTTASDYMRGGTQVPSKDFYTFKGTLSEVELAGTLTHEDQAYEKRHTSTTPVRLKKGKGELHAYASLDEWRAANKKMLETTGPKW